MLYGVFLTANKQTGLCDYLDSAIIFNVFCESREFFVDIKTPIAEVNHLEKIDKH